MDVLVLGPVEARLNGQNSPIGGAKQRALLARLAVARGSPVSPHSLCEDLWNTDLPRNPTHALQARISRLRAALPSLKITLANGGYRLDSASFKVDTVRFERLREEGSWLLTTGALSPAAERLNEALGLWRGPAFADVPDVLTLQAESARLENMRVSALADRIDIDLALGRETEVIPELAALVQQHPLIERHWGQLMSALYRRGHAQEALDVYARARAVTLDRLGVEPSGELGQLHLKILRDDPAETLLRLPLASLQHRAPDAHKQQRNFAIKPLSSHESEILTGILWQRGALILTGPEGIGKTHLLRAARTRFEAQHTLAPLLSANALSQSIPLGVFAGAAGSLPAGWKTPTALIEYFARLRSSTVLLLDNVQLLDDSSLFVLTQLISTSRVPVIVATRSITEAPAEIRALYDSGELTELALRNLNDGESHELAVGITGGLLTPRARSRIFDAAAGNPFRLREIVTGSLNRGRLIHTVHGWELIGDPVPSLRLAQLAGERFDGFTAASLEAAARVAIAGEYPGAALDATSRRFLARSGIFAVSDHGWLRLAEPLDREVLRARYSSAVWHELTREVMQVLQSELTAAVPQARRRAHLLALELGEPLDIQGTLALAEDALGACDEALALRAAAAVIRQAPQESRAHRLAGLATSALGMTAAAEHHFDQARRYAGSEEELAAVGLAHASHRGLQLHDAAAALQIIDNFR